MAARRIPLAQAPLGELYATWWPLTASWWRYYQVLERGGWRFFLGRS